MNSSLRAITAVAACASLFLSSCASIVSESVWPVTVSANPHGSNVKITDKHGVVVYNGSAPTTLSLKSSAGFFKPATYQIEASQDGYHTANGSIVAKMNGWYVGNLLFGGLIGILIVDPATGAMWKLPASYSIGLTKKGTTAAIKPMGELNGKPVISLNDIPQELRGKLVSVR